MPLPDHANLQQLIQRIHWDPRYDNHPPKTDGNSLTATEAGRELQSLVLGAVLDSGVGNGVPKTYLTKTVLALLGYGDHVAAPKSIREADDRFIRSRAEEAVQRIDPDGRLRALRGQHHQATVLR